MNFLGQTDLGDWAQIVVIVLVVVGSAVGKIAQEFSKKREEAAERRRRAEQKRTTFERPATTAPTIERPIARPMPLGPEARRPMGVPMPPIAKPIRAPRRAESPRESFPIPDPLREIIREILPDVLPDKPRPPKTIERADTVEGHPAHPVAPHTRRQQPPIPQASPPTIQPPSSRRPQPPGPSPTAPSQKSASRQKRRAESAETTRAADRTVPAHKPAYETFEDHLGHLESRIRDQTERAVPATGSAPLRDNLLQILRGNRAAVRQAFILSELLAPPLALRDNDSARTL